MVDKGSINQLTKLGLYKDGSLTKEYYDLYRLYNYFLLSYVNEKFHLTKIEDEAFRDYQLDPIEEDKDFYQHVSSLKFFYIRNDLKIENLYPKDMKDLRERLAKGKFEFDEDTKQMIHDSYPMVIKDPKVRDESIACYGPFDSGHYFAPSNAIVLGFRFDPKYYFLNLLDILL